MVLVLGVGLLIAQAARPAPKTRGILEMAPADRVRYEAAVGRLITDLESRQADSRADPGGPAPPSPVVGSERFLLDKASVRDLIDIHARTKPAPPVTAPSR